MGPFCTERLASSSESVIFVALTAAFSLDDPAAASSSNSSSDVSKTDGSVSALLGDLVP